MFVSLFPLTLTFYSLYLTDKNCLKNPLQQKGCSFGISHYPHKTQSHVVKQLQWFDHRAEFVFVSSIEFHRLFHVLHFLQLILHNFIFPHLKVRIVSGYSYSLNNGACLEQGCDGYSYCKVMEQSSALQEKESLSTLEAEDSFLYF